jgi:hypothetical protein
VDDFGVRPAAVNEHNEEQDQLPRHTDDLVSLLAVTRDEVVFRRQVSLRIRFRLWRRSRYLQEILENHSGAGDSCE